MSRATDQNYLRGEQYQDASNLNARIALHQRFGTAKIGWHPWVFEQLDLPPDACVLELGCGPGLLWSQNLERLPLGWQVTLSDFSRGMVEQVRRNLAPSGHPFAFGQLDAQALPFAADSFDAVIANHMLYHVPDRQKTYAEVRRVLKPEGRFYAATMSRSNMKQMADLEQRCGFTSDFGASSQAADYFYLKNGEAELRAWFPELAVRRQEETLVVTEAQPLIDYVLSGASVAGLSGETLRCLQAEISAEISSTGAFRIDKITGLFIGENLHPAEQASVPEFGDRTPGKTYVPRPGAYGLIVDAKGRIAVMETPRGCFLPGGGTEAGETPEETLVREVQEECGLPITVGRRLGAAAEYRNTSGHEYAIRKDCVFFAATVTGAGGAATEADHTLTWLEPHEAEMRLAHGSQQWAVRQYCTLSPS